MGGGRLERGDHSLANKKNVSRPDMKRGSPSILSERTDWDWKELSIKNTRAQKGEGARNVVRMGRNPRYWKQIVVGISGLW